MKFDVLPYREVVFGNGEAEAVWYVACRDSSKTWRFVAGPYEEEAKARRIMAAIQADEGFPLAFFLRVYWDVRELLPPERRDWDENREGKRAEKPKGKLPINQAALDAILTLEARLNDFLVTAKGLTGWTERAAKHETLKRRVRGRKRGRV